MELDPTKRTTPGMVFLISVVMAITTLPSDRAEGQVSRTQKRASLSSYELSTGPYGVMTTLLEKTIFKLDVLTLEIRLNREDAQRVEALARGQRYSEKLADSIADIAIYSENVWVKISFERNLSLAQFLNGVDNNLRKARDGGIISSQSYRLTLKQMPQWYHFLEQRGIKTGDLMYYRICGDTLHTQYWGIEDELLLDQISPGLEQSLSLLGSYFARGSDFRKGLLKSLFEKK